MNDIEYFIIERIKKLCENMSKLDFRASISEKTYSIEFFATENGKRHQCFDMVDEGKLNPEELKQCQREIAEYIRKQADFDAEKINKYRFSWSSGDA